MGFTKKWEQLLACRILLGILEVLLHPYLVCIYVNVARPDIIPDVSSCFHVGM